LKIHQIDEDIGTLHEYVLSILQKSDPISLNELIEKASKKFINPSEESIRSSIRTIIEKGYDVKELIVNGERVYSLVRSPELNEENMYRSMGDISTPIILTGDFHFGSKSFYKLAFDQLVEDSKKFNIKDIMIAGDLIQGRGVYPTELEELSLPSISDQISGVSDLLSKLDCNVHLISGNHEEKVQGSVDVGLEPLKIVARTCRNVSYYGHVANLKLNKDYTYMMFHGSGSVTTAVTHMIEKVWRELISKPNILHMGHTHQSAFVRKGNQRYLIMSGTLQRTNSFLIQKGWNAKIGWFIIKSIGSEYIEIIERSPPVY